MAKTQMAIEIILGFNGDNESYDSFLQERTHSKMKIQVEKLPKSSNGQARNELLSKCSGKYILFLDDDVTIPENYFLALEKIIQDNPQLDIIGGPDLTPNHQTTLQQAIGLCIQSYLAMGPTVYRHKKCNDKIINATESDLILCNLIIKRNIFFEDNLSFHPTISRNEENILLAKARSLGKNIGYTSKIFVFHQRKNCIYKFIKAFISSGYNRSKSCFILPESFRLIYFVPLIFIIYLIGLLFISNPIYFYPLYFYVALLMLSIYQIYLKENCLKVIFLSFFLIIITHLSYGIGLLAGLVSKYNWAKKND